VVRAASATESNDRYLDRILDLVDEFSVEDALGPSLSMEFSKISPQPIASTTVTS
jgi:hypothetical protein